MYKLSRISKEKLSTVRKEMSMVVNLAISITETDFTVLEGHRDTERQFTLWQKRASKLNGAEKGSFINGYPGTGMSYHQLKAAVDLGAYIDNRVSWDFGPYYDVARAMRTASIELNIPIIWGAVWDQHLDDLSDSLEYEVAEYTNRRTKRGKKVFLDGPHFQLADLK